MTVNKKMNENHQSTPQTNGTTNPSKAIRVQKVREQKTLDAFERALIELEEILNSSETLHKSHTKKTINGHEC